MYLSIVIIIAGAVFFYKAAEFEDASTTIWTGLSVLISILVLLLLGGGLLFLALGQAALFVGITLYRVFRK